MAMAAAPVESCQSLPNRSPGGRIGSVLYTCKRLRRMRRRFKHFWPKSLSRQRSFSKFWAGLGSETSRLLHRWRKRCRRLPTTRPTPRGLQEPICPRKKCVIWTRWRLIAAGLSDGEHKIYVNSHYATYIKARSSSEPVRDAK